MKNFIDIHVLCSYNWNKPAAQAVGQTLPNATPPVGKTELSPVWKTSRIREIFWERMIGKHEKFEIYIPVNVVFG